MGSGPHQAMPPEPKIHRLPWQAAGRWLPLALVLALSAGLRFYGLNWDGGHWLHPDERQIYFVVQRLDWPRSLGEALSPASPLNPRFFAYGTLPIYLLKAIAGLVAPLWPALRDPDNLHLAGRSLAALFDLGTVFLTFRLALVVLAGERVPSGTRPGASEHRLATLAAAVVGMAVLSAQVAHFYTADTLLGCLVMGVLCLAVDVARGRSGRGKRLLLGIALGLALATKLTAMPLVLVVVAGFHARQVAEPTRLSRVVCRIVAVLVAAAVVFVVVQPYAVIDWQTYLADVARESGIAWGSLDVPYTRQFAGTRPFLYSMGQLALWGLGLPLGVAGWVGLAIASRRWLRKGHWVDTLLLAWAMPYLAVVGVVQARYLRYMLPLVPVLCLLAVRMLLDIRRRQLRLAGYTLLVASSLLYSLAFVAIYGRAHTWVTASEWVYRTIEPGSTLLVEEWDTALPLPLEIDGQSRRLVEYDIQTLGLYDEPDDVAKWERLCEQLAGSDYVLIASRRLIGSIPRLPERYPISTRYYDLLFSGGLGFELAGEFTRGPDWLNPRVSPLPGSAPGWLVPDESFVVYDHPRVLVLRNTSRNTATALLQTLTGD